MEPDQNPFASSASSKSRKKLAWTASPFVSARGRGIVASVFIAFTTLGNASRVLWLAPWLTELSRDPVAEPGLLMIIACLTLATALLFPISAIPYFFWLHRAYRNLPSLGLKRPGSSPGCAIGSYFVPFMNLYHPWEVMCEIWTSSYPRPTHLDGSHPRRVSCAVVGWWWFCYLASGVLSQFINFSGIDGWWNAGQALVNGAAATLIIFIIRRVDLHQQQRHELRGQQDLIEQVQPQLSTELS